MKTKEFSFDLPEHLIAQFPADKRGESRLLVLDRTSGTLTDSTISHLPDFLIPGALMVVNDSKVRKARVYGESETGGKVEFLFLNELEDRRWSAMVTKSKKQRVGKHYRFTGKDGTTWTATIDAEHEDGKLVRFDEPVDERFFEECGHMPLPPYIKRTDTVADESRYQTVYADKSGSVAAPTAGLHFTEDILGRIAAFGITITPVTLHVGAGTFLPVRSAQLEDHHMHLEHYEVPPQSASLVTEAKRSGRPVIAVGTTSVRTLESAFDEASGTLVPGRGSTRLFILPPYRFKVVDHLMTNFHTPESTLLVLVSAFAGKERIMEAYRHAVSHGYRFFSYGDAMFIR
ncbi:MAG: tRNA preQ1(34) S-adenosylmethionine ribosyltransferase-isomerase QueA [Sphaerochaetaceae bacterium]|nr:tRNA preQ1(34) S-adenosylmethionine ribosyltransferase-isomerase QueA [Sphaerochaetaceae bacterium]